MGPTCRLLSFDEWYAALGRTPDQPRAFDGPQGAEVSLSRITGTLARGDDFDRSFRPVRGPSRKRVKELALAMATGSVPPVSLVRLGELHFVEDGHHRIAAAHALGAIAVDAVVRRICTVAFACRDLATGHLAAKLAERRFLEQVALPDPELRNLWLGDPVAYGHLTAQARRWAGAEAGDGQLPAEVAQAWWHAEVLPRAEAGEHDAEASLAERYLATLGVPVLGAR